MKKFNFNSILNALVLLAVLTIVSCAKDQDVLNDNLSVEEPQLPLLSEAKPELANDISLQNGLLTFKSVESYRNTLLALNKMTPQEQLLWENNLEFTSMQQLFNAIILAEYETIGSHSELYINNLQSNLILENESTGLYDLGLFNPAYAPLLNSNGLIQIENSIYQFTKDALKVWKNGNLNQLEYLLDLKTSNDDIQVIPMNFNTVIPRNVPHWTDECESGDDTGMLRLTAVYNSDYLVDGEPEVVFIEYFITALSMKKTSGNEWEYDPDAVVKLKGKSHIQFTVSDGENERIRDLIKSYPPFIGYGGNYTFIPSEAGNYEFGDPWFFVNPAHLMRSLWDAQNKLGDGSIYTCGIEY